MFCTLFIFKRNKKFVYSFNKEINILFFVLIESSERRVSGVETTPVSIFGVRIVEREICWISMSHPFLSGSSKLSLLPWMSYRSLFDEYISRRREASLERERKKYRKKFLLINDMKIHF